MDNFSRSNRFGSRFQLLKNWREPVQPIVRNPRDNEPEPELREIILNIESPVNCDKYVKAFLSKSEKRAVLARAPAALGYGPDNVSWEGALQSRRDALV